MASSRESGPAAKRPEVADLELPRPRRRRRIAIWLLLPLLIGVLVWAATSESPGAQQFQEFVGWSHRRAVTEGSFSIGPHSFSSYKFSVPAGAVNVAISGEFSATGGPHNKDNGDNSIEAYVLTDAAFTIWQNGYATSSHYESGRVAEGTVSGELPAGAGVYYLVFSNKFSPRTAKTVQASVILRYKSWLPEWLLVMRDRFWNSIGL